MAVSVESGNKILGFVDENEFTSLGNDDTYSKIIAP